MKTFEQWKKTAKIIGSESAKKRVFDTAREGMIPADHAIEIPDEKLWPWDAKCIEIRYLRANGEHIKQVVPNIFRRKIAWIPHPTDKVFVLIHDFVHVGIVFSTSFNKEVIRFSVKSGGKMFHCGIEELKEFSIHSISLPWDQI